MENSEKIKCPMFAVWINFVLNFFIIDFHIFEKYDNDKGDKKVSPLYIILLCLLIILIIIQLIASILITLSFEKNKYSFYLTGLIISLVFSAFMTGIIIKFVQEYIIIKICLIITEWGQLVVLLLYNNLVRKSFKNYNLNNNLINGGGHPKPLEPEIYI